MVSGTNKKLKVVWLCHYANQEMLEYFKKTKGNEFAPWISILIDQFKSEKSVELHIVAPNVITNQDCCFIKDGIHYHFYKYLPLIPIFNKYFRKIYYILKIEQITDCFWIKKKVPTIINNINPDLIHLHGAENPYYSAGILPIINKYPLITTIQGFIKQSLKKDWETQQRIRIEEEIIKSGKHFGTRTEDMNTAVLKMNNSASLHFHNYPLQIPLIAKENIGGDEPVDCLFFARVCKDKGIEDLLDAIAIVKQKIPDVSLHVIGSASWSYLSFLNQKCKLLDIEKNVNFLGFFKTQKDIYKYALKAKVYVITTYHDIIPGTLIESMFIKLPAIAYSVGGIPEINSEEETVKLVEKQNVKLLANAIQTLLESAELRKELAGKAYSWANRRINNGAIVEDILKAYKTILNN